MNIGFIDYYLDEWHANNYPRLISEATQGKMRVNLAYGHIDSPIGGRTTDKWCEDMGIRRAGSIDEVCEQSDCIIVLSPDNCEMHELLCQKPLRTGKRVYVDKTFAPDFTTAKRIFDIAEASGTPCYSTSALRYASEYQGISDVSALTSVGPYRFETYAIHQLEPVMMLIGSKPEKVMYVPGKGAYSLSIAFEDGRTAQINGFDANAPFLMNLVSKGQNMLINVKSDFFGAFIRNLTRFFETGEGAVPHEETLRIMAVRGAGVEAIKRPCEWVRI
ncbi:MAG: hypothetical protein K5663_04800 [Clostridiales bacterium]|nr:hypothetical protein [Clostridiales bacterium]